jgi:hypothetical protein
MPVAARTEPLRRGGRLGPSLRRIGVAAAHKLQSRAMSTHEPCSAPHHRAAREGVVRRRSGGHPIRPRIGDRHARRRRPGACTPWPARSGRRAPGPGSDCGPGSDSGCFSPHSGSFWSRSRTTARRCDDDPSGPGKSCWDREGGGLTQVIRLPTLSPRLPPFSGRVCSDRARRGPLSPRLTTGCLAGFSVSRAEESAS